MLLVAALLAAFAVRVWLPVWRRQPQGSPGRALAHEFGVRPRSPDGRWTRAERLRAAVLSGGAFAGLVALSIAAFALMERWPNLSAPNLWFSAVGFGAILLSCLAAAAIVLHVIAALFAPRAIDDAGP